MEQESSSPTTKAKQKGCLIALICLIILIMLPYGDIWIINTSLKTTWQYDFINWLLFFASNIFLIGVGIIIRLRLKKKKK